MNNTQKEVPNFLDILSVGFIQILLEIVKKFHIVLLLVFVIIHRDPKTIMAFGDILVEILSSSFILGVLVTINILLLIFIVVLLVYFNSVIKKTLNVFIDEIKKKRR